MIQGIDDPEFLRQRKFLKRLAHYAPLVKQIDYPAPCLYTPAKKQRFFDHHSLNELYVNTGGLRPLFPNVTAVELPCFIERPMETVFYPAVVLGQSVKAVTLLLDGTDGNEATEGDNLTQVLDGPQWAAIAARLQPLAANLTSFSVRSGSFDVKRGYFRIPSIEKLCNHFTSSLARLNVDCLALSPQTLLALTHLDCLTELSLSVCNIPSNFTIDSLHFARVKSLDLDVRSLPVCLDLLPALHLPSLETVNFEFSLSTLQTVSLEEVFKALAHNRAIPHLCEVECTNESRFDQGLFEISGSTFDSLLDFKKIKSFHILGCSIPELDNMDLLRIFSSWPALEEFSLHRDLAIGLEIYRGKLTLEGVHAALQHCPKLHSLDLPCDTRQLPSFYSNTPPHPSLKRWQLYNSPITSGRKVGEFLRRCYPQLDATGIEYLTEYEFRLSGDDEELTDADIEAGAMLDQWNDVSLVLRGKLV
ncbi:hypothetical protein CC1G_04620 [Coprinopsis cinerea okayama7|uniref:F-box domain-containing protein n=1 Tax=Coprinopsis cinerea (strain Okayama-7 / 130 / ATCC MYA-4618 / FGSC 9003) TaxID=240176 RepID=A8N4W0_COPC7|nr:hypothetical protein CC1G_04620 [Coprinopsis cinerea okayama7\|eukprot:XP_001829931.1 hypothetical protein CC1G_04620 [Coprinopsis cinerea okayama7\